MRCLLLVALVGCYLCMSMVDAWFNEIETEQVYGRTVKFCTYEGVKYLPRSGFTDYKTCTRCICKRGGMECFALVGKFNYSPDSPCVDVTIGCKTRWVLRRNKNRRCPRRLYEKMQITGVL